MQGLPPSAETWLLVPVAAPDFSLPGVAGHVETLSARRGKPVLLYFWSAASPTCGKELAEFNESHAMWAKEGLQLLAINADDLPDADGGSALAPYRHFPFPILRFSPDVVAIYNILYRYFFDRHRDLRLPTGFLLDASGAIVKIYQGSVPREHRKTMFR